MADERLKRLAEMLLKDALEMKEGEMFQLNSGTLANPLNKAIMQTAAEMGLYPVVNLRDHELERLFFGCIDPEHPERMKDNIVRQTEWELKMWESVAAHIDIGIDENYAELAAADSRSQKYYRSFQQELRHVRIDKRRWTYLHWPTMAAAQKAGMCYDDFYEFFLNSALVDYRAMSASMVPLVKFMEKTDRVHIKGPGTDLTFSIRGIPVVPCDGHKNIPDGEVFTAPVRDSVNGVIQYNTAAMRYGKKFLNPRLVFKDGRIVEATCDNDTPGFNELLDADEGARYVGEFALGVNNSVTRAVGNTLYDEKIGGSFHFTPGCSYEEAPNGNISQLHLDIVCIQKPEYGGGEIWFDGELIRKDGLFLPDELKGLNP
ncbi:MAG: aminopeptidase [Clostridia bacterium]|nr:aminopeptidase [Clostridia bacterium]